MGTGGRCASSSLGVWRRRRQKKNPSKPASTATTGTATTTPIATPWLFEVEFEDELWVEFELEFEDEVGDGVGSGTPIDCGMLAAPAWISTTLLKLVFSTDCAMPIRWLERSYTV